MVFVLKDGSGSLFTNTRKETENHPDWTGEIKIAGKVYWLSGWTKKDKNGNDYFSLSAKEKIAKTAAPVAARQSFPPKREPEDGEIPFAPCL